MHDQTQTGVMRTASEALARCVALGIPACIADGQGTITAWAGAPLDIAALLQSDACAGAISRVVRVGAERLREGTTPGVLSVDEGVCVGIMPVQDDAGGVALVVPVLLSPEAAGSALMRSAGEQAGLEADRLAHVLAPVAHFDDASTPAMHCALTKTAQDLCTLQQQRADIENFTSQVTTCYDTIDVLYALGRGMKSPQAPEQFLQSVCSKLMNALGYGWVGVWFVAGEDAPLSLRGLAAHSGKLPAEHRRCADTLLPLLQDLSHAPTVREGVAGVTTPHAPQIITQAIMCRGRSSGVLAAGGKASSDHLVSSYDTQLLEACSGFVSTFIENVALYDDQQEMFLGTLQALTAAVDAKDRYTCGHSERVAHVSWRLAQAMGMTPEEAERVRIAGLVHDVGKIGVPEAVLTKPGKLTDEEFGHIKRHPEIGFAILRSVPQMGDVLPGVMSHHERYDGRGYPHGLRGDAIPLQARIIAVADTFDAMSSDRSYRKRLTRAQVLAEIAKCAGSQLDPRIAQIMLTLDLREYDDLSERHARELLTISRVSRAA